MVCNMLVVINAKLDAKYADELLKSEAGVKALASQLAQLLGGNPRIEHAAGYAVIYGPRATVVIRASGIQVQASRLSLSAPEINAISKLAAEVGQALAIPLAQERLVSAVKQQYGPLAVTADARQGASRVTRIRVQV